MFERDEQQQLHAQDIDKIRRILARLNLARVVEDIDAPGFRLHPLKGKLRGYWAVTVRSNWRVIFRFKDGHVLDVNLVDYH